MRSLRRGSVFTIAPRIREEDESEGRNLDLEVPPFDGKPTSPNYGIVESKSFALSVTQQPPTVSRGP
jgi:hypothetical protein